MFIRYKSALLLRLKIETFAWNSTLISLVSYSNLSIHISTRVEVLGCPPSSRNLKTWQWKRWTDPLFLTLSPSAKSPKDPNLGLPLRVLLDRALHHLPLKLQQSQPHCSWQDKLLLKTRMRRRLPLRTTFLWKKVLNRWLQPFQV